MLSQKEHIIGWRNIIYAMMHVANVTTIREFSEQANVSRRTIYDLFNLKIQPHRPTVNKLICFARRNFNNETYHFFTILINKTAKSATGQITTPSKQPHALLRKTKLFPIHRSDSDM